jgi:LemA protein
VLIAIIVIIVVAAAIALAVVLMFNRLVRVRNRSENAWAQVDVQLKRRADLVPNLVEAVKGYASHEQQTFEEVTRARAASQQAQTVPEQAQAENMLSAALGRLLAVAEAYPQLRATENFQNLQNQLSEIEEKLAISRQVYNDTVLTYENALETLPTSVIAAMFRFRPRVYFETDGAAREAPKVQFT